jgi:hypothetical protein
MMDFAFMAGLVPTHLHGSTQYKTLGARLSEDILRLKRRSRFFRTRPGRFFLREFIHDKSLPLEFRTPIVAARRRRQLRRTNVASIDVSLLDALSPSEGLLSADKFKEIVRDCLIQYINLDDAQQTTALPIYSYVIISRADELLLHSKSPYAEDRPQFIRKPMLGFPTPVCHDDLTLFDRDDHGLVSSGLTGVANDLDLEFSPEFPSFEVSATLLGLTHVPSKRQHGALVGVVSVEAPEGFEPSDRRLAIGSLEWARVDEVVARRSDLDPWSRTLLGALPAYRYTRLL